MRNGLLDSTLASKVYERVRRGIVSGELRPGQPMSRRRIATELRTSPLPVASALQRLEFEGLLESRPRAGTRVRIPSPEDVKGHYVVREALEVQAAVRFTQAATAEEQLELRELAERVDALAMGTDRPLYVSVHHRLHASIAECARCPALLNAIEKTHALSSIWFCVMREPQPDDSTTRHRDLVAALCSGDAGRAADAVREHLAVGMEHSLEVLQPYFRLRKATGRTFYRSNRKLKQRTLN